MLGGQGYIADNLGGACIVGSFLKNGYYQCPGSNKDAIALAFMNSYQLNGQICSNPTMFPTLPSGNIKQYGVSLPLSSCLPESGYKTSIPVCHNTFCLLIRIRILYILQLHLVHRISLILQNKQLGQMMQLPGYPFSAFVFWY